MRKRGRAVLTVCAAVFAWLSLVGPVGALIADDQPQTATYVWRLVNEVRTDPSLRPGDGSGQVLPPLARNTLLDQAAWEHNHDMIENVYYGDKGLDGSTVEDRVAAAGYWAVRVKEVLGLLAFVGYVDPEEAAQVIVSSWVVDELKKMAPMASGILDPQVTEVGIAFSATSIDLGADIPTNVYVVTLVAALPEESQAFVVGFVDAASYTMQVETLSGEFITLPKYYAQVIDEAGMPVRVTPVCEDGSFQVRVPEADGFKVMVAGVDEGILTTWGFPSGTTSNQWMEIVAGESGGQTEDDWRSFHAIAPIFN